MDKPRQRLHLSSSKKCVTQFRLYTSRTMNIHAEYAEELIVSNEADCSLRPKQLPQPRFEKTNLILPTYYPDMILETARVYQYPLKLENWRLKMPSIYEASQTESVSSYVRQRQH